jgi:anti-sigma factor RsiW
MDTKCRDITGLLALYHYGELEPEEAAEVEAHLAGCKGCAAELDDIRAALSLITPDTPTGFEAARVRTRVLSRISARRKNPLLRFAPAFAGAALIAITALIFNYRGIFMPPVAPPAVQPNVTAVVATADLDMMENYDLVANLDLLEDMDTVETMEEL